MVVDQVKSVRHQTDNWQRHKWPLYPYFCGAEQHQHVALYVRLCVEKKISNVARRRQTSHDVARLLLMVPIEPWQNSTPIFGAAAFCTIKIEDFRASLTSTFSTTSSAY